MMTASDGALLAVKQRLQAGMEAEKGPPSLGTCSTILRGLAQRLDRQVLAHGVEWDADGW